MFFTYVYCNPLKPSSLLECGFEPFYVGKGKDNRHLSHLREKSLKTNSHKNNTIKHLLGLGVQPVIVKLKTALTEQEALDEEKYLVETIGRSCLNQGPLTNVMPGGQAPSPKLHDPRAPRTAAARSAIAKGLSGRKHSVDRKAAIAKGMASVKAKQQKKWLITTPETSFCIVSLDYLKEQNIESLYSSMRTSKPITRGRLKGWSLTQIRE